MDVAAVPHYPLSYTLAWPVLLQRIAAAW